MKPICSPSLEPIFDFHLLLPFFPELKGWKLVLSMNSTKKSKVRKRGSRVKGLIGVTKTWPYQSFLTTADEREVSFFSSRLGWCETTLLSTSSDWSLYCHSSVWTASARIAHRLASLSRSLSLFFPHFVPQELYSIKAFRHEKKR